MDTDSLKALFPILGGILALAGGVFTFVSGRLRDAEGADAKAVVARRTLEWLSSGLSYFALLVAILTKLYIVVVVLFVIVFVLQAYMFVQNPSPPRRVDVLTFGMLCATFVTSIALVAMLYLFERVIYVQGQMVEIQQEMVKNAKASAVK